MLQKLSIPILLFLLSSLAGILWLWGMTPAPSLSKNTEELATATEQIQEEAPPPTPTPTPKPPIRITFLGDMMFDRNIRTKAEAAGNYDFILEPVEYLWQGSDLVVGNLEAPITNNPSVSQGSEVGSPANFTFTTDPAILDTLSQYPFVANLGNNHIFNFYDEGIVETRGHLENAEIPYFGYTGYEDDPAHQTVILEDITIAFINYNQFVNDGIAEGTLRDLEELSETTDLQIIYTHWGNEYERNARPVTENLAYQFVEAGADLIIGSHPHVIQNNEVYMGVPIYYSLGNFVFDQYFSEDVRTGLVVTAEIDPENLDISTTETIVRLENTGQTVPASASATAE